MASSSPAPIDTLPTTEPVQKSITPSDGDDAAVTKDNTSSYQRVKRYLQTDIALAYADIPVISTCIVSGLCDASAYNAWSCFVSMQTGNTVFLALGASGQPAAHPQGWIKSLISIVFFLLGCVFFSLTRYFRPSSRLTLAISFLLQSLCIVVAAALVQAKFIPSPIGIMVTTDREINYRELIPLAFLAFQSGGQIVTSRLLGFNEVPTTVLTSVYCDLAMDQKFFVGFTKNIKRNRRFCSVVAFLVGAIAGGWISRSVGLSVSFWIAAAIKLVMSLGWVLWKASGSVQLH